MTHSTKTETTGTFLRGFVEHPASVGESYFGHARFAFGFAGTLLAAACCAAVHAIIPPLFETTASRMVRQLATQLEQRH
ncbi:MAG: DUF6356 family protein [Pseudomonadota bacterium]